MEAIKKIVVIGPESTGKSTLCEQLAKYFETSWVPEYAREYLEKNGTNYSYDDLLTIAKGQIELEEEALKNSKFKIQSSKLFIDTDMYVMKVWCEFVFNKCHNWILNRIAERKYDYYLLCNVDLEWVHDTLREYPDKKIREKLYQFYKDILVNQPVPWIDISGNYEERFQKAVSIIETNHF
jgi:NadR type nicotinamide-nucleotide adenylyltransferase